jgi:PKD repeat protein
MKYRFLTTFLLASATLLVVLIFGSFTSSDNEKTGDQRANTAGLVTFTATTSNPGGTYNPKHVLAIWVEKNGVFVKTRKAMANARKQWLLKWKAASNYNVVDAITGSTLTSHQTHTVTWDCKDLNGNVVVDGDYTVILEFTDKHSQGPFVEVTFNKGTQPVTMNPANQTYIKNISLTYTPMSANFNANVTQVCTAQNVTFTDNSTGATSWAWNFGSGASPATATTQGPHNVTYSTPGNKTVSLTINGAITETKTNYITVSPDPVANFSYQKSDLTVTFTNTSQNANSYLWNFGDGNTSTQTSPVHTYLSGGSYVVSLTSTSNTCGNDVTTQTIILETATANFSANVTQVCVAQNVTFTDNSTAATSWAWNFGSGASPATANTQGPHNVTYSTSGSKTVSLTINGAVTETKTNYITVSPDPVANFSYQKSDLTVTFTNTSQNANSYLWDFGDGNTSTQTSPVHTYLSGGSYVVSLTSASTTCGNDVTSQTIILETAAANFSANVTQVCTAQGVIFTDNSTAATSWAWNFGAGASPATASTQGPHTVNYSTLGNKTVSLTINGSITETKTNYITVYPEPVASFTWSQAGLIISFSNTSLNAVSYLWNFGDGNTSTETSPVHTYSSDGTYLVSLTSTSEMCGNDIFTETLVLNTIGISEPESGAALQVFPNPSNGRFAIVPGIDLKDVTLRLYNLQGKLMTETNIGEIGKDESFNVSTLNLTAGMYFLDISTDQKNYRKKVFIK